MIIRKTVRSLILINGLQFAAVLLLCCVVYDNIAGSIDRTAFLAAALAAGVLLLSSLVTLLGLYAASRYQDESYRESMKNLESLNAKLRAQRHDYLNHIQVIHGLMELGEYEDAKKYMAPVFADINRVTRALKTSQPAVNALLQAKMESAAKKGILMYVEVGNPLKRMGLEAWEVCKILANLIDNAVTALEETEGEKKITVEIRREGKEDVFYVKNNGPRIPDDMREPIFRQGFTTKKEEGHGMGLAIVSDIVREAGGSISFSSGEKETCFEIRLPAAIG